jgi:hypothetical protein
MESHAASTRSQSKQMPQESYYAQAVTALGSAPAIRALGFRESSTDIRWSGKGIDRHDLMVVTKPAWTVRSNAAASEGYEGVNVHFESRGYGSLQVDCELTPRLGSEAKKDQRIIAPLLQMKVAITRELRSLLLSELQSFHVNTMRTRSDPSHPSSLKVVGFDLGLPRNHLPQAFVAKIVPIVVAAVPFIDQVIAGKNPDSVASVSQLRASSIFTANVVDQAPFILPPIPDAAAFLRRVTAIRGLPERNMEDLVKQFFMLLGHSEHSICFQIGHVDLKITTPSGCTSIIIEVKRKLNPMTHRAAVDQAFVYATRNSAKLVVISDADTYEIYNRSIGECREDMFVGRFQLTQFHSEDEEILDALRPR